MGKTIYRIRGNVFLKLFIYILVTLLAYSAMCFGGLMWQGLYMDVSSDSEQNMMVYRNLVDNYVTGVEESLMDAERTYVENVVSDMTNVSSYSDFLMKDFDGDGVIGASDVAAKIKEHDLAERITSQPVYGDIESRGDLAYEVDMRYGCNSGDEQKMFSRIFGNSGLATDSDDAEDYRYGVDTVEVPVIKYAAFDVESDMEEMYGKLMDSMYSEEKSDYTDSESLEQINKEQPAVTEAVATTETPSEMESDMDSEYNIEIKKRSYYEMSDMLYKGEYPVSVQKEYFDGAYSGGQVVSGGYVLKLTYGSAHINMYSTVYVDHIAVVKNINDENPDILINLKAWKTNFDKIVSAAIILALSCIVLTLVTMINSGVKAGEKTIKLSRVESVFTEVPIALFAGAVLVFILLLRNMFEVSKTEMDTDLSFATDRMFYLATLVPMAVLYTAALLMVNNLFAKIKAGRLISDSAVIRFIRWTFRKIAGMFRYIRRNVKLGWRGVIVYIAITLFELAALAVLCGMVGSGELVPLYIIFKTICIVIILIISAQVRELYLCAMDMANGNLDRKADIRKMFWIFKAHGEHLNQIGDGMAKAVDERMKSEHLKTELITNVSHDIKTPLTSIINYVDLLEKGEIDEKTEAEYIEVLSRQSSRLKKLIEDLVEASKASTGNIQMNFADIDAGMLLEQAVAEYSDKLESAGLSVVFAKPDEPAVVIADGQYLWRVFDNLLANISKYAMRGTRVYATVFSDDSGTRIEFKNISREALNISSDELMERFVRGDSSRNTEGSGLGLSIANSLCSLMNAEFRISIDGDLFKAVISFKKVIDN